MRQAFPHPRRSGLPLRRLGGTLQCMGHNVSDRKLRAKAAAERFARDQREAPARAREIAFADKVVDIWNARLGRGAEMFFSPTIGGAIAGGLPWLSFYCSCCQTAAEIGLREADRHRGGISESYQKAWNSLLASGHASACPARRFMPDCRGTSGGVMTS